MDRIIPQGDIHDGRQTCLIIRGEDRFIWKPRNAVTERCWAAFLSRFQATGLELLPGTVTVLEETEDAHTEAVIEHCSTDENGIRRYYGRLGALLFLTYLLYSGDLHAENLIACGEYPVLVDLETLLSGITARQNLPKGLDDSVFASHLLPQFYGLTDTSGATGEMADGKNIPLLNGVPASAVAYVDEIVDGFSATYTFALAHREEVDGWIRDFAPCRFRLLPRPTALYGKVIDRVKRASDPQREAEQLLRRAYERDVDPDRLNKARRMWQAEVAAVVKGEVPLFYIGGEGCTLYYAGEPVVEGFLRESPVSCACHRLQRLSDNDRKKQIRLIRLAYCSKKALLQAENQSVLDISQRAKEEFSHCAVPHHPSCFIRLCPGSDGYTAFQSVGYGLYHGLSGILCCYAALSLKTGDAEWRRAIDTLLDDLEKNVVTVDFHTPLSDSSCNLSDGLAGIIAALLHVAELTGCERAFSDAVELTKKIDVSRFVPGDVDILSGMAGICLSLPRLPSAVTEPIATVLLSTVTEKRCTLTGAAHGVAGQALALGALQQVLGTDAADEKILSLLRWENTEYDPIVQNWSDLRETQRRVFMRGWCSGTPGVLMCRRQLMEYTKNEKVLALCRQDIEQASDFLKRPHPHPRATLCCGEGSLVMAGARLGISVENRLEYAVSSDSPRLFHAMKTADRNPSLMQGLAGVVYALMMQNDPRCGGMLV